MMAELLTVENAITLGMLILLQVVLGFDNLLYISIESKRVKESKQGFVRQLGIAIAILLRIVLLFAVISAIDYFREPFFSVHLPGFISADVNVHSFIVLVGGIFIIYTAIKEIYHMILMEEVDHDDSKARRSVGAAITWIVLMNLVFSFDSILSALALTQSFPIMATAIIIGGLLMIWMANNVAEFLKRNRMYEVLGLFILFIVGIMLLSEGGHLAHLHIGNYAIEPMAKSTFYFVIIVLVVIDLVQSRYQKKLLAQRQREIDASHAA